MRDALTVSAPSGGAIEVFSYDPVDRRGELRSGGDRQALYCFIIAIVATGGIIIQNYYFGTTSEYLQRTLRVRTFGSILRQDVSRRSLSFPALADPCTLRLASLSLLR
jgi:hypothetical protein